MAERAGNYEAQRQIDATPEPRETTPSAWEIAARELEQETGARNIHLSPGTDPNTTVAQIKEQFYKALNERTTPPTSDEVRDELGLIVDEICQIVHKHMRVYPGFTYHPVYIDAAAREPIRNALLALLTQKEAEIAEEKRRPIDQSEAAARCVDLHASCWQANEKLEKENNDLRSRLSAASARVASLFDAIAHGDGEHREWLRDAIVKHFAGEAIPPPRGKGSTEALRIALAEAESRLAADGRELEGLRVLLRWAVPLAESAIETTRLERLRCGHDDISGTYQSGTTYVGIYQSEVDAIERARAALTEKP